MKIEVAKNAKRNFAVGLLNKLVLLILPFVNRSVITIYLGGHYLGLSSLFTSIMQVLSLAELGFSSAIVYHMYKPIARDDRKEINALLLFYRKAYRVVGLAVLVIGGCVMPFLPRLIHGSYPEEINIYLLFSVYILNSSLSYFLFAYKQSLLSAYQREDLHSLIHLAVKLGLQLAQVAVLLLTRNYYYYILCLPLFTLLNNLRPLVENAVAGSGGNAAERDAERGAGKTLRRLRHHRRHHYLPVAVQFPLGQHAALRGLLRYAPPPGILPLSPAILFSVGTELCRLLLSLRRDPRGEPLCRAAL